MSRSERTALASVENVQPQPRTSTEGTASGPSSYNMVHREGSPMPGSESGRTSCIDADSNEGEATLLLKVTNPVYQSPRSPATRQNSSENCAAIATTLQEVHKLQQYITEIAPMVTHLKEGKAKADQAAAEQLKQLGGLQQQVTDLVAMNCHLADERMKAASLAAQHATHIRTLQAQLTDLKAVNSDLCLEMDRLKEASESSTWPENNRRRVKHQLEHQTAKAEDAEAERAEAVKMMICEKERARQADICRCQAENGRDEAQRSLEAEKVRADQADHECTSALQKVADAQHTAQQAERGRVAAVQLMLSAQAEARTAETAREHATQQLEELQDASRMHGMQCSPMQDFSAVSFPGTPQPHLGCSSNATTPGGRLNGRPVVPPLDFKPSLSTSLSRKSPVTFRLLKDFVALPHAATVTPGRSLLLDRTSTGPLSAKSAPLSGKSAAATPRNGGSAAHVARYGFFWRHVRRVTGALTACIAPPCKGKYNRME